MDEWVRTACNQHHDWTTSSHTYSWLAFVENKEPAALFSISFDLHLQSSSSELHYPTWRQRIAACSVPNLHQPSRSKLLATFFSKFLFHVCATLSLEDGGEHSLSIRPCLDVCKADLPIRSDPVQRQLLMNAQEQLCIKDIQRLQKKLLALIK